MIDAEMTCQHFVELVTDYLEGALPAPERARFEAHLADCPYCDIYLDQIRQTIALVGTLSEAAVDPQIKSAMLARFRDWTKGS